MGLLMIASALGLAGALEPVPVPQTDALLPPVQACTPPVSLRTISVEATCVTSSDVEGAVGALPLPQPPSLQEEVRKAIAGTHDHDDRYYTEQESDARFLGIAAKAADADRLDGIDSSGFAAAGHDHDARYLGIAAKAADSDKLDGLDGSSFALAERVYSKEEGDARFLGIGAKAADAARLDGLPSSQFMRTVRSAQGTESAGLVPGSWVTVASAQLALPSGTWTVLVQGHALHYNAAFRVGLDGTFDSLGWGGGTGFTWDIGETQMLFPGIPGGTHTVKLQASCNIGCSVQARRVVALAWPELAEA